MHFLLTCCELATRWKELRDVRMASISASIVETSTSKKGRKISLVGGSRSRSHLTPLPERRTFLAIYGKCSDVHVVGPTRGIPFILIPNYQTLCLGENVESIKFRHLLGRPLFPKMPNSNTAQSKSTTVQLLPCKKRISNFKGNGKLL